QHRRRRLRRRGCAGRQTAAPGKRRLQAVRRRAGLGAEEWYAKSLKYGLHRNAVPPAAAKRLIERDGVGETRGLRLHAGKRGLQIGLLRVEQHGARYLALLDLAADEVDAAVRGLLGGDCRVHGARI